MEKVRAEDLEYYAAGHDDTAMRRMARELQQYRAAAEPMYQAKFSLGWRDVTKEQYDDNAAHGAPVRIVYAAPQVTSVPQAKTLELAGWQFKSVNGDWLGLIDEHGKNQAVRKGCVVREVFAMADGINDREHVRREHAVWSQSTFGNVGPVGPLKHLAKEALEAAAEPDDLSEWADMQFLLWDAQRRAGITDELITQAMVEKLAVNKQREWPEPKDGEPRLHIAAPAVQAEQQPVTDAEHVASVLEMIGSFEPDDIDSDSVDLRFELNGVDTGSDVSITEYATRGADIIRQLSGNTEQVSQPVLPATQFKPVADLYGIAVPGGRSTSYSTDAAEASDCRVMGWDVQEFVKLERLQEAITGNSPAIPDGWLAEAERLAEMYGTSFVVFRHGEEAQCADPTKVIISFTDEGLGHHSAAPKQEAE